MKSFRSLIEFPKIAVRPTTRRANKVSIYMELNYLDTGEVQFHVYGNVWNIKHTTTILGGQCLEELRGYYKDNALYNAIYNLWKRWHMNHMRTGTAAQVEAVINWNESHDHHMCYNTACEYLKSIGLYEVPHPQKPGETFCYGSEYIAEEIPPAAIDAIKRIMKHCGYTLQQNGKGHIFEPDLSVEI